MSAETRPIDSILAASLRGTPAVVSAYVFGSVAADRAHRERDVDVGILLERRALAGSAERFEARLRLTAQLQTAVARDVDLVILNDAPPQLSRHIMTSGRRLVVSDPSIDHAFLRTVLSRAADLEPFLRRTRRVKLAALAR